MFSLRMYNFDNNKKNGNPLLAKLTKWSLLFCFFAIIIWLLWRILLVTNYTGKVINVGFYSFLDLGGNAFLTNKEIEINDKNLLLIKDSTKGAEKVFIAFANDWSSKFDYSAHNDYLIELSKRSVYFVPIVTVQAEEPRLSISEIDSLVKKGAFCFRLVGGDMANFHRSEKTKSILNHLSTFGVVVFVDPLYIYNRHQIDSWLELSTKMGNLRFVIPLQTIDHLLVLWRVVMLQKQDTLLFSNIVFDISGITEELNGSPYMSNLLWLMRRVGIQHFVISSGYGSDSYVKIKSSLSILKLTLDEQRKILFLNARNFLLKKLDR